MPQPGPASWQCQQDEGWQAWFRGRRDEICVFFFVFPFFSGAVAIDHAQLLTVGLSNNKVVWPGFRLMFIQPSSMVWPEAVGVNSMGMGQNETVWVWVKMKPLGDLRFWSLVPFTRVPFCEPDSQPYGHHTWSSDAVLDRAESDKLSPASAKPWRCRAVRIVASPNMGVVVKNGVTPKWAGLVKRNKDSNLRFSGGSNFDPYPY